MNTTGSGEEAVAYLRPETAGAIFIEFNNILDSTRLKIPFGVAQIGKAFRNEIVAGNFIFRLREFEQMEIEFFISPNDNWQEIFNEWLDLQEGFAIELGVIKDKLRRYEHPKEKLSHYSQKTIDIEYDFPFGFKELYGLAYRGDYDLSVHSKKSGVELDYFDETKGERYIPHIIEPTFGLDRSVLAALDSAYTEEEVNGEIRIVVKFPIKIAPVKLAIFPLLKNKPELVNIAKGLYHDLKDKFSCEFDDNGNIGKRYRRQDEIGTPFCATVDFDSINDNTVTMRDRDTLKQQRIKIPDIANYINQKL